MWLHYTPTSHTHLLLTTSTSHSTLTYVKFKVWTTIVESGWNVWVWLVGVVSRRRVWLVGVKSMGVASGCGCKEVYRFPQYCLSLLLLYLLFFCSSIPTFCSLFFVLVPVLFVIKFYVLNNFLTQYKHTYGQLRVSHGSHMKAAHNVLYMKKHTQTYASYPAMYISMTSRSLV